MGFLDNNGLSHFWQNLKQWTIPTRSITTEEYNGLSEEEKMANVQYIITDDNTGGGTGGNIPAGGIIIWSGTADEIPDGWALCDGENGTPDLRGKFVLGVTTEIDEEGNTAHPIGDTGGSEEVTLTVEQIPKHNHTFETGGSANQYGDYIAKATSSSHNLIWDVTDSGDSQPHNNMPPYYALCYIMKL